MSATKERDTSEQAKEILVYAFSDLPVKIIWIKRSGEVVRVQHVSYEQECPDVVLSWIESRLNDGA